MATASSVHYESPPELDAQTDATSAGRSAPSRPRAIDERLMSDFLTAVNALPWASARRTHAELIESFVWLGWLRRDGHFIGLGEEGARIYALASRRD